MGGSRSILGSEGGGRTRTGGDIPSSFPRYNLLISVNLFFSEPRVWGKKVTAKIVSGDECTEKLSGARLDEKLSRFLSPPFFFIKSRRRLRLRRLRRSRKEREILLLKKRLARVGRGPFSRGPFWRGGGAHMLRKEEAKLIKKKNSRGEWEGR